MDRLTKITDIRLPVIVGDKSLYPAECYDCCIDNKVAKKLLEDAIAKLAEYEDLEEQGKLLKLPAMVGQKLWVIWKSTNEIASGEVTSIGIYGVANSARIYVEGKMKYVKRDFDEFGKTVFLTKSAAETALKEMEGDEYFY